MVSSLYVTSSTKIADKMKKLHSVWLRYSIIPQIGLNRHSAIPMMILRYISKYQADNALLLSLLTLIASEKIANY